MLDLNNHQSEGPVPGAAPDPVALAAGLLRDPHPLFPREDGSPEDRDIVYVTLRRRRTGDHVIQNYPEDIPAGDVHSWAQIVNWFGGGEYKIIGKNAKHHFAACYPAGTDTWECFDGPSKPFTLRDGSPYAEQAPVSAVPNFGVAPPAALPAPGAATPTTVEGALLVTMQEILRELQAKRGAPASNDSVMVAMIQAQGAQATAQMQAMTELQKTMFTTMAQRPADAGPRTGAEPLTIAVQLIDALKKFVPQPAASQGVADFIPVFKAVREMTAPVPTAPASEFQPLADLIGQAIAADSARSQTEALSRSHSPPTPSPVAADRVPPRPRAPLVHVPGVGIVEVVAPDAGAPAAQPRSIEPSVEDRAAAIRRDPELVRALGLAAVMSHQHAAAPAVGAAAGPVREAPVAPVAPKPPRIINPGSLAPAMQHLEPHATTPHVAAPAPPPPVVAVTAAIPATVVAAAPPPTGNFISPPRARPRAVPGSAALSDALAAPAGTPTKEPAVLPQATEPTELASGAPAVEAPALDMRPPIALPAQMPVASDATDERYPVTVAEVPEQGFEVERMAAEIVSLAKLPDAERQEALRRMPGVGAHAREIAQIIGQIPADALPMLAAQLPAMLTSILAAPESAPP